MNIETITRFFLWCTIINYGVLILWSLVFLLGHDLHYRLTKRWFRTMSVEQYDMVSLGGIAAYKIAVLVFNLVPYVALCIIGRG